MIIAYERCSSLLNPILYVRSQSLHSNLDPDVALSGRDNPIGGGATKIFSALYALFLLSLVYVNADALEYMYRDVFEASEKSSAYHFLSQSISVCL